MTIIYALAVGLSVGAAATVARRIGERDPDGAARAAAQSILFALGIGAVLGATGILFAPELLHLMGASDDVVRTGSTFARVMIGASGRRCCFSSTPSSAARRRRCRDARPVDRERHQHHPGTMPHLRPDRFPLGVTGAAIGTSIGRWTGVAIQIYVLTRRDARVVLRWAHMRLDTAVMKGILRISGTARLQNFIATASYMGQVRIIAGFGSAAVAGNTIGIRVILFALLPSWGVSNAAVTLVGQNLGAGKPDRAEASAWKAGLYNTICLGTIGVIFLLFAPLIVRIFTNDEAVRSVGVQCLRIVSAGFLFYGYGMVLTAAFNGAGDTRTPTLINLVSLWILELPLAWVLAHSAGMGPSGSFVAMSVGFSTLAFLSAWIFSKGHWKTRQV